ncbi:peptidylprolyl isomerase [Winogradskyella sp. UBA3174]|uniref:peptidylprolyl isomerase n=1 Tax=Winogradskyella sp. UBA3174 TaxID=1947785 RepID=UPI0025ECE71E|nr:peptidylprolyl isomerase [Winogradskyella sp. UBA3174]|tara:strand:+ start:4864 stop:6822 length:1959 start_codon:yes stop_codon:yes gene_type:complete
MSIKFKSLFILLFVLLFVLNSSFSQSNDGVLLTVDGDQIKTSEFLRVYNKNLDLVKDESQKDVDGYLKLFTEYQLKLKEAKRLKLDENAKYLREFLSYKKQLTKNYLSDNKVTDVLVKEAYERSKLDIKASHILVRIEESSSDTAKVYNQLLALKERVLKEGYDKVKYDAHDGQTIFLEDLGYFSAFKMVYDFETVAFNTPAGKISEPFRTQFGYHVVKVDEVRLSRGTITAAHIMVTLKSKDSTQNSENRINAIYSRLQKGEDFESLAKQFSDDKSSANSGGKLAPFKSGQLTSIQFEDEAFTLKADEDFSKPFKTEYGWHIVKRISLKQILPFEDLKPSLESRVKRDARSRLINSAMVAELEKRYTISRNKDAKAYFETVIDNRFFSRAWKIPELLQKDNVLFTINNNTYTYYDFGRHLLSAQRSYNAKNVPKPKIVEKELNTFYNKTILKYREDNLELENKEFAYILQEYRDGLLLFELMEKEIWNKASKDSIGIENYYNQNKVKYQWSDRVDIVMASSADKNMVDNVSKMMKRGKSEEVISSKINEEKNQNIIFTKGVFSSKDAKLPENLKIAKGISRIYEHNGAFHVIDVKEVIPAGQKTLEESRGNVINDYQTQLELDWIDVLYKRFDVSVNKSALKAVKTKIKNQ